MIFTSQQLHSPIIDVQPTLLVNQPSFGTNGTTRDTESIPQQKFDQGNNLRGETTTPATDMADSAVLPPPFSGKPSENPSDWFRQFTNYCQYKDLTDQKRVELFKFFYVRNSSQLAGKSRSPGNTNHNGCQDGIRWTI